MTDELHWYSLELENSYSGYFMGGKLLQHSVLNMRGQCFPRNCGTENDGLLLRNYKENSNPWERKGYTTVIVMQNNKSHIIKWVIWDFTASTDFVSFIKHYYIYSLDLFQNIQVEHRLQYSDSAYIFHIASPSRNELSQILTQIRVLGFLYFSDS